MVGFPKQIVSSQWQTAARNRYARVRLSKKSGMKRKVQQGKSENGRRRWRRRDLKTNKFEIRII